MMESFPEQFRAPQTRQPERFEITLEEMYLIIGELEIVRRKQIMQLQSLYNQIGEMSAEITRLKNGGLVKTDDH